ncbi:MAG: L-2-amino-thiazoline-4-carboxylic acid hydrolase [Clostridia bacterium]|nr:L-2-amino-thiazoline-4-carboxylic acid hydrolase [Clostridia bacterium]
MSSKLVRKYGKLYRKALEKQGFSDVEIKTGQYERRFREMLESAAFKQHNVYPTMNVPLIYAVIAMCLELRDLGLSDSGIMAFTDVAFATRRKCFDWLIRIIDLLPNSFEIARKWNISDHAKRVQDHSITYDSFEATEDVVEYRITRCMYVEMFEYYGIRKLCRIFCNTDTRSYAGLTRHVHFIRHSDLSDGPCCRDEVHRKSAGK